MGLPAADTDWGAADGRVWSHAPFDRRRINKRFEARSGLAVSLHRVIELVSEKVVAAHHGDHLAGFGVDGHHRALHAGNLIQLDFHLAVLLINVFDDELGEITGLELTARRAMSPTHICSGDSGCVITEASCGFVAALVYFRHQPHQVAAGHVVAAIPIRVFVAGQFLWCRHATVRRSRNRLIRRMPTGV